MRCTVVWFEGSETVAGRRGLRGEVERRVKEVLAWERGVRSCETVLLGCFLPSIVIRPPMS